MDYIAWRNDIFAQKPESGPVSEEIPEAYSLSPEETFDHIDRALDDEQLHDLFSRDQIGAGLRELYDNGSSDLCFCYTKAGDDRRRIKGIGHLTKLYDNYFNRYCVGPVTDIGNDQYDDAIGFRCYMFWDVFILNPGNASAGMISAALSVMEHAIQMRNENCVVSAIHGLGHWALDESRAVDVLQRWLRGPTTRNAHVLAYARQAATGYIL